jgi:preprotein translocase subunit SecD
VSRQGNNVVIDLPGVKNATEADQLVGKTAELRFRLVQGVIPYSSGAAVGTTTVPGASTTTVKGATTTVKGATSTTAKPKTSTTQGHSAGATRTIDTVPIVATRPAAGPTTVAPTTAPAAKGVTTTVKGATTTTVKGATTTTVPANAQNSTCRDGAAVTPDRPAQQVILPDKDKIYCYLLGPTILTGRNIGSATAIVNQQGQWQVDVHFKNNDFVNKVASPNVGKQVAIVLDGIVQSAPKINQGITGQNVTITGNFSSKEAHQLALVLRYGSLPVQLTSQTAQSVSPTLGKDQLRAGIISGLIGLALVALYMIFFYRLLGLVVWTGIGLTGLTFFSLVSWLSAHRGLTLTLAGVTGIIVSVGVTVDSYVVYFERLKDEVRTGKTVRSSLDVGFHRAFRTILAADLVSLIGAIVLYVFATSSVKGFAYFLGLSTLLDLALAYLYMWPFVSVLARRPSHVRKRGVGIAAGLDTPEVEA